MDLFFFYEIWSSKKETEGYDMTLKETFSSNLEIMIIV